MADISNISPRAARDGFERYYAEKIWEWIPGVYKHEDGLAQNPGVLRALVEVMAQQAAVARRGIDRLWDDTSIDVCDDWAVPYLADLVGTRLVHELNRRGRRVDVARTLFYRRRKGTPTVMEALVRDITGWEGAVVESFRRLGRARHGFDPEPDALAGRVTGTPPGGTADLRRSRGADLVDGPFGEFAHTADFRRLAGLSGRYNISKLNFHLYRLRAFPVRLATPFDHGAGRWTFDPSGRDVHLFRRNLRRDLGECRAVREWELPAPIPCRLLGAASYELTPEGVPGSLAEELASLMGQRFTGEARLRQTLASMPAAASLLQPASADLFAELLAGTITADSPKVHLLPLSVALALAADPEDVLPRERLLSGNLADWDAAIAAGHPEKHAAVDPVRGRFLVLRDLAEDEEVFAPVYVYGFPGEIGAGTYDRRAGIVTSEDVSPLAETPPEEPGPITGFDLPADGVHELLDSRTYEPIAPAGNVTGGVEQLCLQARDGERPYVRLVPADDERVWTFEALPKPEPADPEADRRELVIDGLWLGVMPTPTDPVDLPQEDAAPEPTRAFLRLDGIWDRVVIRHATLDPGGEQARVNPLQATPIPEVALEIVGEVGELVIESSIVGPIHEITDGGDPCSVGRIVIRDSIVRSQVDAFPALATRLGDVHLERVTVLGDVEVNRLWASETLVQGVVRVTDNQHGCFRFSAAAAHVTARLPPQYESHLLAGGVPNHVFESRRFGDPGYARLASTAPEVLRRGAENRSEIGAWNRLFDPVKREDLEIKVGEYMPLGLVPQFIFET